MKPILIIGILFVAVGVIALAYQGITYVTRETVVEAGPVKVTTEKEKTLPLRHHRWRGLGHWGGIDVCGGSPKRITLIHSEGQ